MKFFYESHANKSGIYKIINIHTSRIYIGQAKDFKKRWYGHKSSLTTNKNQNKFLQNDFNKYKQELGHDDFLEFYVLEIMENSTKEERNYKEEFYIASVYDKQENCYNFKEKTEAKDRSIFSLTPEETSKKLSKSLKKYYSNPENRMKQSEILKGKPKPEFSDEHKAKLSEKKKGRILSEETKQKMSESHKSNENLNKLKETYEKHKEHIILKQREAVSKIHILVQPDGIVVKIKNLNKFCKERNMHSSGFSNLLHKLDPEATYKGWKYLGSSIE